MLRSLYISKTGMDSSQFKLDVVTNNLANTNTTAFKKGRANFNDLMYQVVRQPGSQSSQNTMLPTGLLVGTGSTPVATERIFTQGNPQQTSNSFDLDINGRGFFNVQQPDGTIAYTRDGTFHTNDQGQLVTSLGFLVDPAITVPQGAQNFSVSSDGIVTVKMPDQTAPQQIGQLQISDFINPQGLESIGNNMYLETAASGTPTTGNPTADGLGTIMQGYLEASNVNVTEELINMIEAQRSYELNSRGVKTSDEMLQRLAQL